MKNAQNAAAPGLEMTYTLKQVSVYFHVSEKTIRRWIKRRIITAHRAGLRKYIFTRRDIEAASPLARR